MSYLAPKEILDKISGLLPRDLIKARGTLLMDGSYYRLSDGEARVDLLDVGENVPVGAEVEVEGYLTYTTYMQGGGVYAKLKVKNIKVLTESENSTKGLLGFLEEKLRNKTHRGFWGSYIQGLLEKEEVLKIAVIHGKGAQVHRDFEQAFNSNAGPYRGLAEFSFYETSLSDESLSQTLLEVKDYTMVFLLRGGGAKEELQRVGGMQSAMVVLEHDIPLYLALGHSLDKSLSLMEKVAEYSFATPSIAGAELGKAIRQTADLLYLLREREHLLLRAKQAEDKIKEMQNQINPIPILFALLAGGVIGFLLKTLL